MLFEVIEKVPDAKLYVIGGARVWSSNAKIGALNIAHPHYEKRIKYHLKNMSNVESVHFLGVQDWIQIKKIIKNVRLGIVNPSLYMRDETFCMSAIEMSAHGIPVISRKRNDGLKSTIIHSETGFMEVSNNKIAERTCELLKNKEKAIELGENATEFAKTFRIEESVVQWRALFEKITNAEAPYEMVKKYYGIKKYSLSKDSILLMFDRFLWLYHKIF